MNIVQRFYSSKPVAPSGPANCTGGTLPIDLEGRHRFVRQRITNMNDEERAFRRKFLHDQHLSQDEPVHVPELYQEMYNPIRRIFKAPMNIVEGLLAKKIGERNAFNVRFYTGKLTMGILILYVGTYYFLYNSNNWERKSGWRVHESRAQCVPGDPGFPRVSDRTLPKHYADRGFSSSPI
ncbi:NADH dehydrogenase 1, beta subcomplex, subunit 6 [Cinara cedri]|uniref:NADH dehydrogenase 1, beta subcomplex, subunit 6 n=1 Tax=Cinara cedri TaxID=506608 RepID=A0A5E4NCZ3_9HEMI|nr:NADH dehydrogenase 1, beta subcomplex, subunit 6 [Cinara cedri]